MRLYVCVSIVLYFVHSNVVLNNFKTKIWVTNQQSQFLFRLAKRSFSLANFVVGIYSLLPFGCRSPRSAWWKAIWRINNAHFVYRHILWGFFEINSNYVGIMGCFRHPFSICFWCTLKRSRKLWQEKERRIK